MVNDWADAIDSATRGLTYAYAIAIGNKTYDGTNEVTIHVPHFGGLFYQDELYGDGIATMMAQKDIDADEITVTLPSQILRKTTNRDLL